MIILIIILAVLVIIAYVNNIITKNKEQKLEKETNLFLAKLKKKI